MANPLLTALVQAAVSTPTTHGGKGGGRGICFTFSNTGMCQHGDNCRFEHVGQPRRGAGGALIGPDASKKSAGHSLIVQPNLHDFFGFANGAAPTEEGMQYSKVTVIDRADVISQLVTVDNGQLTHRLLAVPAAVHSEVRALVEFFSSGSSIAGRSATTQDMHQQLRAFVEQLRASGWCPGSRPPTTCTTNDLAGSISELTALLRNGLNPASASTAKRSHEPSPGDTLTSLNSMSPENRTAVLNALGAGNAAGAGLPPGPSPPRKTATLGHLSLGIPSASMPPLPGLPLADLSAGTIFADEEMPNAGENPTAPNAELNRIENELLALARSSSSGLPSVRDKAQFEETAPLNVAALDGMLGPRELDADAVILPDLSTMVSSQPAEIIASCRELIPKVVRQLNLVFKPQRRLELLLRSFGWSFVARAREPVGVVSLSICIARKAAGLAHTPN